MVLFSECFSGLLDEHRRGLADPGKVDWNDPVSLVAHYGEVRDEVIERARQVRHERWNNRLFLMPPLYFSNGAPGEAGCREHCQYCPWRHGNVAPEEMLRLSPAEVEQDARYLLDLGYQDVEIVAATDPLLYSGLEMAKYADAVRKAGARWTGVNVFPLSQHACGEFMASVDEHVFSIIWQETYDPEAYQFFHPEGPKSNMRYRLDSHDRECRAGMKVVGVAFLGGLADWRTECLMTLAHARHLRKTYGAKVIFGMPRWKGGANTDIPVQPYPDEAYQFVGALYSLMEPDALVWFSTRESYDLSIQCVQGGGCVFTISCSTSVGGYTRGDRTPQFPVNSMNLSEGLPWLRSYGYDPQLTLPW